jgi:predicted AlkP superfamily phosphohydrolase/phosphomutase
MTVHDMTVAKIQQLPESLVQEVSDFIDFLLMKQDSIRWQLWNQFTEAFALVEGDFSDYLRNLEDYENRLARGEIKW